MKITTIIAFVLAIVGAVVWGLVGIFDFNVVAAIFGAGAEAVVLRRGKIFAARSEHRKNSFVLKGTFLNWRLVIFRLISSQVFAFFQGR